MWKLLACDPYGSNLFQFKGFTATSRRGKLIRLQMQLGGKADIRQMVLSGAGRLEAFGCGCGLEDA